MGENLGNSWEFPIIPSLEETVFGIYGNYWELRKHQRELILWEFPGILNNSKNFKVTVNLGTLAYFYEKQ